MSLLLGEARLASDRGIRFPAADGDPPPPGPTAFVDPAPGTTGSTSFPAPWTPYLPIGNIGGIVDHQSGLLRINTPSAAFDAPALLHGPEFAEFNVRFLMLFNPGAAVIQYPSINYRYDTFNADGQPDNGYDVYFARQENQIGWERRTGATTADSTVVGFVWGNDLGYEVKISCTAAGVHKIKVWQFGTSEPTTGGVDGLGNVISENDNVHPGPGKFGIFHGAQNANRQFFLNTLSGTYQ